MTLLTSNPGEAITLLKAIDHQIIYSLSKLLQGEPMSYFVTV